MLNSFVTQLKNVNRIALFTVILPTCAATIYFGFIASDVYVCESDFIIRSTEQTSSSALGLLLKGVGVSRSDDDSYAVQEFMLSRDALRELDRTLNIRAMYSARHVDPISRFPGPILDSSFESLYKYYARHVAIEIDPLSSISTLEVRSFSPQDSVKISRSLIENAETLINTLNVRAREDMVAFAEKDVAAAAKKDQDAAVALARYRNQANVIDPERQSVIPLENIAKIEDELLKSTTQLAELEATAKDNPRIPSLKLRIRALQTAVRTESARVTGGGSSLAGKAADYQRLALEKEFDAKMLASALSTLEQARTEAEHKQIYLELISQPTAPDKAMEPRRLRMIAAIFGLGLILWGIVTMLVAAIREHQD